MMETKRHNNDKPRMSIVPRAAIEECAKAMEYGAKKYSMHNWRVGGKKASSHYLADSALRHIYSYLDGEDIDAESNNSHIGHALANLAFIAQLTRDNAITDDRYKPVPETPVEYIENPRSCGAMVSNYQVAQVVNNGAVMRRPSPEDIKEAIAAVELEVR